MARGELLLSGTEYVLIAEVPGAGDRWHQVHFNQRVISEFFRLSDDGTFILLEGVTAVGLVFTSERRPLVYPASNRNPRIEFDFGGIQDYPDNWVAVGRPILVILEAAPRHYRYLVLMPGVPGYESTRSLNDRLPTFGRGLKRSRTTLDQIEAAWPACPLRRSRFPTSS